MTASPGPLALVADIGGTNSRFALTDPGAAVPVLLQPRSLANDRFTSLQQAAAHYLAGVGACPARAAMAVASPVDTDRIQLTNRAWSFERDELRRALGLQQLRLLNDFGALAWAVPALQPPDFATLRGGDDGLRGPVSVLGPGTGLGVAQLVGGGERGWQVVETEGGHVGFAPVGAEERAIAAWLEARFGRVSNERLLSGDGLAHIDAVLRGVDSQAEPASSQFRAPAQVLAAALAGGDEAARRALERFCAVLGSVAGDAALIHGARTMVIAGGIVPRFIPFLRESAFAGRFLDKGRFADYLQPVAVRVVTHPNPGLLGAAVALRTGAD